MKLQYYEIFLFSNQIIQQVCIPEGCVPAASRPYAGVCFPGGGLLGGGVSAPGRGCLLLGGSGPRGVVVCFGGVWVWSRGGGGGGGIPACTEADPPCEQNE